MAVPRPVNTGRENSGKVFESMERTKQTQEEQTKWNTSPQPGAGPSGSISGGV